MSRTMFVISDLHLGGVPASERDAGFQMCPPEARRRLARMLRRLAAQEPNSEAIEVVINGDFVDFLAEEPFTAFTEDSTSARDKFLAAVAHTHAGLAREDHVFSALAAFTAAGHQLTILLGNHDLELSLPSVRRELMGLLPLGRLGRINFVYDGEAYAGPGFVIEHGNRMDGWNLVSHGTLRTFRSAVSRGEPPPRFSPPPGSELVSRIMNPVKERYRFIDLLKPENEAMIPLLVSLEPDAFLDICNIWEMFLCRAEAARHALVEGEAPEDPRFIARSRHVGAVGDEAPDILDGAVKSTQRCLSEMASLWGEGRSPVEPIAGRALAGWCESARSLWNVVRTLGAAGPDAVSKMQASTRLNRLRDALRGYRGAIEETFRADVEHPAYDLGARRLAQPGGRVVVLGHTHLAKDIRFPEGGRYLNPGTWCSTIEVADSFYDDGLDESDALEKLRQFVEDMRNNALDDWCRLDTYCARLEVDDHGVRDAALCQVDEEGRWEPRSPDAHGLLVP